MKTITNFIEKYGMVVILMLVVLSTCTNSMAKRQSEKRIMNHIDSVKTQIQNLEKDFEKEIKIEGLKAEKRMIQSTDRKILDVTRQTEIDKEIQQLEK